MFVGNFVNTARMYGSKFLVMKAPKNVEGLSIRCVIHVKPKGTNTTYIVFSLLGSGPLSPMVKALDANGIPWEALAKETLPFLYPREKVAPPQPPQERLVDIVAPVREHKPIPEEVEELLSSVQTSMSSDAFDALKASVIMLCELAGMGVDMVLSFIRSFCERESNAAGSSDGAPMDAPVSRSPDVGVSDGGVKFSNPFDDVFDRTDTSDASQATADKGVQNEIDDVLSAIETSLGSEAFKSVKVMIDVWLAHFGTDLSKVLALLRSFLGTSHTKASDDVPAEFRDKCVTRDMNVVKLNAFGTSGTGFFIDGVFVTALHVTKGSPIQLGDRAVSARSVDEDRDLVAYGGYLPSFEKCKVMQKVYVYAENQKLEGCVVSIAPFQVRFPGAPVLGLSGSPILTSKNKVAGVYSNHLLESGTHLSLSTRSAWVDLIASKLRQQSKIAIGVPCGRGKSTYLVKHLSASLGMRVLLVVPRSVLPSELAKFIGKSARGFAGEDRIDDSGCDVCILSHGKFINAVANNPNRFDAYDCVIIDESHDMTAMTKVSLEWVDRRWSKKAMMMTGSPLDDQLSKAMARQSKHAIVFNDINISKAFDPDEMAAYLSNHHSSGAVLIQVPSSTYAKKVIGKLGSG